MSRRYVVPTAFDRVWQLLLGPVGAGLMVVAVVLGIVLLLGHRGEGRVRSAMLAIVVGAFLLMARSLARAVGIGEPVPAVSWEFVAAAAFGTLLLGLPGLLLGSIVGRVIAEKLLTPLRASIEALLHEKDYRPQIVAFREVGIGLMLLTFGLSPVVAVVAALGIGCASGVCVGVQQMVGRELVSEGGLAVQIARVTVIVAVLTFVLADGRASF